MPHLPWAVNMFIAYGELFGRAAIRNIGEKLLALVIGFLLWNYVTSQGYVELTLKVPVEFVNLPENVEVVGVPSHVEVRVEGAPWAVKRLGPGDVKVQVLVKDVSSGSKTIELSNVKVPEGVKVLYVRPSRVRVRFVVLKEKEVPVVVRWRKRPNFTWRVSPMSVKVIGSERVVSKVKFVPTQRLSPRAVKSKGVVEVRLNPPKGVRVEPERVRVEVVKNG